MFVFQRIEVKSFIWFSTFQILKEQKGKKKKKEFQLIQWNGKIIE